MEGFKYVVNPTETPKICFGTSLERKILPMSGPQLSPFMRRHVSEVREAPGPSDYAIVKPMGKSFPSKLGFSVFASKLPRLSTFNASEFPPIGAYSLENSKVVIKSKAPFGTSTKRYVEPKFLTPGPPTYPFHVQRRQMKLCTTFGSRRIIWPEVASVCSPTQFSKCFKCGLTPHGDYWHDFKGNRDMCRPCMNRDLALSKNCATDNIQRVHMQREHNKYTQTRYCGFYHDHHGTTAATQIISTKTLHKKINLENYLMLFTKKPQCE